MRLAMGGIIYRRLDSSDHRQVKRERRRMVDRMVRAAITSRRLIDWFVVIENRKALANCKKLAKQNAVRMAFRQWQQTHQPLYVPNAVLKSR